MTTKRQIAMLLLLAAVAVGPAWGQETRVYREGGAWVQEVKGTLAVARNLRVKATLGSVRVQGGSAAKIVYVVKKRSFAGSESVARREFERFRISANRRGDVATIAGDSNERSFRRFSVEFAIDVPASLDSVRIDTRGGTVNARNLAGRVDVSSGGGSLRLNEIGGPVTARSSGGNIEVNGAGGDLLLKTGGGGIKIASAKGRVDAYTEGGSIQVVSAARGVVARTGGGSIDVHECNGELDASTEGGSIETAQVRGRAVIRSGGGSIRLLGADGPVEVSTPSGSIELLKLTQGAHARTGAGSIRAEFLGAGSGSSLSTSAGDIIVYLSPAMKVTVDAAIDVAGGHHIRSDFPELKITSQGGEYGPRSTYAEGRLNGGGPTLRIRTTSGDIELRRVSH